MKSEYINGVNFTRVKNDINGNGRVVVSWLEVPGAALSNLAECYRVLRALGGRKYTGKDYGGGVVFQCCEGMREDLARRIKALKV